MNKKTVFDVNLNTHHPCEVIESGLYFAVETSQIEKLTELIHQYGSRYEIPEDQTIEGIPFVKDQSRDVYVIANIKKRDYRIRDIETLPITINKP